MFDKFNILRFNKVINLDGVRILILFLVRFNFVSVFRLLNVFLWMKCIWLKVRLRVCKDVRFENEKFFKFVMILFCKFKIFNLFNLLKLLFIFKIEL